jgi:hypothetical protein
MESASSLNNPNYNYFLSEIVRKYGFIQSVWLTDSEGALISNSIKGEEEKEIDPNSSGAEDKQELDKNNKIKVSLSFQLNSVMEQTSNLEKWKTKYLVSFFDTMTIFQSKISKTIYLHFICDSDNFNYEIMKEITGEIKEKLLKYEKEFEQLIQTSDIN